MFKIGIISDEVSSSLPMAVDWAKENEVFSFELRTVNGPYIHLITPEEAKTAASILKQAGIEVNCLASSFGKCNLPNANEVEQQFKNLEALIERSKIFETSVIRAFAGWRYRDIPASWPGIVEFFSRALEILPADMALAIENEPATGCATLADVAALREAIGDNRIRALFDPGNYGYDVGLVRTLKEINVLTNTVFTLHTYVVRHWREYNGIIRLVHCKNVRTSEYATVKTVGLLDGLVDFPWLFRFFREANFDVPLDLEPHRAAQGQQLEEAKRAIPGGPGYGNIENATADLKALRDILSPFHVSWMKS